MMTSTRCATLASVEHDEIAELLHDALEAHDIRTAYRETERSALAHDRTPVRTSANPFAVPGMQPPLQSLTADGKAEAHGQIDERGDPKVAAAERSRRRSSWPARVTSTKPISAVSDVPLMTMTSRPTVGASAIRNACGTMMCRICSKRDMPIDAAASHWVRAMASIEPRQISVANELALSVSAMRRDERRRQLHRNKQGEQEEPQEELHQKRRSLQHFDIADGEAASNRLREMRASVMSPPTMPPPTKAMARAGASSGRLEQVDRRRLR